MTRSYLSAYFISNTLVNPNFGNKSPNTFANAINKGDTEFGSGINIGEDRMTPCNDQFVGGVGGGIDIFDFEGER